jgi:NAD(P)H-flavin reductase
MPFSAEMQTAMSEPGPDAMLPRPFFVSAMHHETEVLVHTIRAVGTVTRAMRKLNRGSVLAVRRPYGSSWPVADVEGSHVVIGLAPLRPALVRAFRGFNAYAEAFRRESEAHE